MVNKLTKSAIALAVVASSGVSAASTQPNVVAIMLDDVTTMDISAYHRGLGAVSTPNIDRIAERGMMVSDYYAQGSSTAGRSAFITGQYPIRTGLTSVGQPGSTRGLQKEDPTLAEMLKDKGYATVHVGKSHLGDNNDHLPTVHGFDEFYGFLYHLNVMEMHEQPEFPKDPNFKGRGRNMIHTVATDKFDDTVDPRFGVIGKQTISDQGELGAKRMQTVDGEFLDFAINWLEKHEATNDDQPYFMWYNPTRMHQKTHVRPEYQGASQHNTYYDGLVELDDQIGVLLDKLEATGEIDNTIILFTSDNGVNLDHWPDSGAASFRGQKGTTWDGGFRVPMLVSWPAKIPQGEYTDGLMSAEDWVPTIMAAAGDADIKQDLLTGKKINDETYKVHIDGYNQLDMLTEGGKSNRHEFFFYNENSLNAFRVDEWKVHLKTKTEWIAPADEWPLGMILNIKADPFERSPDTRGWFLWMKEKTWVLPKLLKAVGKHQQSLKAFPPRLTNGGIGMNDKSVVEEKSNK
ncbi:sulfatase family protein [Shewanella sediminis HAW-EB3]|uniref:Sulfatase family protein n=1 Tax=Shewanella sediminis (strain HAW-EB3) TaxID=425104 RepID=A8G0H1_SHESH|nr:arylsulfatase [Shewanella sediminis]ABV38594.1 sulfatase family protein [Shewanella sediminis HAW-EB3]